MNILFLTARFPQLPFKGDQTRTYHQIRLLSQRHRVSLISLAEAPISQIALEHLRQFCERIVIVRHHPTRAALNLLVAPFTDYPFQTLLRRSAKLARVVREELKNGNYDLAHVQLVRMAPYLEDVQDLPRVIDLIDALSLNMERRYRVERGLLKPAAYLEWQRLKDYERKICEMYDEITVVSAADRAAIGSFNNIHVNPNGVDLAKFDGQASERKPSTLVFVGTMDYFPNIDAACYFVREVLPLIKRQEPDVQLNIVGANPTKDVRQLASDPAVQVRGFVPDLMEYLGAAAVAVCPMRSGSGMQFKTIEAMAAGTPVVATPFALGGLEVVHGEHILVAKDSSEFADHVVKLLRDKSLRDYLVENAIRLVRARYTWEACVAALEQTYERALRSYHKREASDALCGQ